MFSVCLPSDALSQHLPSYLGFSYLGRGISLHSCSSKLQPLFVTLDKGYLLTAAPPDLERGIASSWPFCACAATALGDPCLRDHILSDLSTMTRPSWVALHYMAHSFIELDKAVFLVASLQCP